MLAAAGVEREPVERLADICSRRKNGFLNFYCMGLNQSTVGMWKNNSIINLHLLLGEIGKPGAGPFSLTGQPKAMGGRESRPARASASGLPVHRQPRASRRGRAPLADAARRHLGEAGPDGDRDVPGPRTRAAQGDLDRGDESRRQHAGPASGSPRPGEGAARGRAGRVRADRDGPVRRRASAGRPVRREGMDQHEQRAHGELQSEAGQDAPARYAPRLGDRVPVRPRAWVAGLRLHKLRRGVERVHRSHRRPALRHGGHHPSAASARERDSVAVPDRGPSGEQASYLDGRFPTPDGRGGVLAAASTRIRARSPITSSRSC